MLKVLFMTDFPSPYRVDFFNRLGAYCDLTVSFEGTKSKMRNSAWRSAEKYIFHVEQLKSITIKGTRICVGMKKLLDQHWDVIVIGVYNTPASIFSIEYLKFKKMPFCIEADGGLIKNDYKIVRMIKKHLISSATYWFSSGKMTTEYLSYYGAQKDKCFKYNFTSLSERDIEANSKTIENNHAKDIIGAKEKYIVLSVGRFNYLKGYGKGYDVIMRTASLLGNDFGFYIVGDEPTEEFINWKNRDHLDNVHFVGFKSKEELSDYYLASDIFCLMTIADVWGLVINEAMSFGLPIITTKKCVAGVELVQNDVNGYVINVGDSEGLAKCIEKIILNKKQKQFGIASKQLISNYTTEFMAKQHISVFDRIVNGGTLNG